jgi:DNA-binding winged helix-turn-helix (wHTH) protein
VGEEELFKTVWTDAIIEEANLSSNIAMIRQALGDDETVPKRGYRFIAKLQGGCSRTSGCERLQTPPQLMGSTVIAANR